MANTQGWCICELQGTLLHDNAPEIAELRTSSKRKDILEAQIYRSYLEGNRIILKQRFILLTDDKLMKTKKLQACNVAGGITSKFHFAKQPQSKN
jgi:hypothetical protein